MVMDHVPRIIRAARYFPNHLDRRQQEALLAQVRGVVADAPLFQPKTRRGKKLSVRMTSAGRFGWYSDRRGYRYERRHPGGAKWPAIPALVEAIWRDVTKLAHAPDSCLINYYGEGARMGLHQDRDEACFDWPVVSVSLGDDALFRIGGPNRGDATESHWLSSGDVIVLAGESRLAFHGVDRIRYRSCDLMAEGGRINLTLRMVT